MPAPARAQEIDLHGVPAANTAGGANLRFQQRARAITRYLACLPGSNEDLKKIWRGEDVLGEGALGVILAKLESVSRGWGRHCPGDPPNDAETEFVDQVNRTLSRAQVRSRVGTPVPDICEGPAEGEYDTVLRYLIMFMYRYRDPRILWASTRGQILRRELILRGARDPDLDPVRCTIRLKLYPGDQQCLPFRKLVPICLPQRFTIANARYAPETENHILQEETSRYLTNQLLFRAARTRRESTAPWNNVANGMNEFILKKLRGFLVHDFYEYNARPYEKYSSGSIQNLYDYADPLLPGGTRVKTAARNVLDYLAAKFAVSSTNLRREVPFRRRIEYYDDAGLTSANDESTNRFLVLAGNLQGLGCGAGVSDMSNNGCKAARGAKDSAEVAAVTSYRVPDLILDLIVNSDHRRYFERIHEDSARVDDGSAEVYAAEPTFLISAGGIWDDTRNFTSIVPDPSHFLSGVVDQIFEDAVANGEDNVAAKIGHFFAHLAIGLIEDIVSTLMDAVGLQDKMSFLLDPILKGLHPVHDEEGQVRPTTLIPTFGETNLNRMIRFEGKPVTIRRDDEGKIENVEGERGVIQTCVAPHFACGERLVIPQHLLPDGSPCRVLHGRWVFIDASGQCDLGATYGFFVAAYGDWVKLANGDLQSSGTGFFEVVPAGPHFHGFYPSFTEFRTAVLAYNEAYWNAVPASPPADGYRFTTFDGRLIRFDGRGASLKTDRYGWRIDSIDAEGTHYHKQDIRKWRLASGDVIQSYAHSGYVSICNPFRKDLLILDMRAWNQPRRTLRTVGGTYKRCEDSMPKATGFDAPAPAPPPRPPRPGPPAPPLLPPPVPPAGGGTLPTTTSISGCPIKFAFSGAPTQVTVQGTLTGGVFVLNGQSIHVRFSQPTATMTADADTTTKPDGTWTATVTLPPALQGDGVVTAAFPGASLFKASATACDYSATLGPK